MNQVEILNVLRGDFEPIDSYMGKIAYKNLDPKLAGHKDADQVRKLLKIQQLGAQLLQFKLMSQAQKCKLLQQYCEYEERNEAQLKNFRNKQKEKLKELTKKQNELDYLLSVHENGLHKI